ncbi:hypothetical protein BSR29_04170 [Boudabousia liubingyangii]|uniref:N-acetyltransferase domain-containing protein n=1 Tax=Boudabousia liubingyangii TaxID=1921764 RepID=A0A1Q5PNE2_9ACTO|nr:GNAT family N-acetyltransferase [Boudabousia liubingyangii]OKL47612.1 hypothetical protein BSR28_03740 [Boudabousia liubingyangii]OKL49036.1 hypothetical protein BSR29_04170 [Boudabousia liubingyangii]
MALRLETPRLILQTPKEADIPAIVAGIDEEVLMWTSVPSPYTEEAASWFVNTHVPEVQTTGGQVLGIYVKDGVLGEEIDSKYLLGTVEFRQKSNFEGGIGCWLAPEARHHGIMTEALRALLTWAFSNTDIDRVEYHAAAENWDSRRVAWACGFRHEGISRKALPASPERIARGGDPVIDRVTLSILKGDPMEAKTPWYGPLPGQPKGPVLADSNRPDDLVRQFHDTYECPILLSPTLETDRLGMRMDLILEEACELVGAVYGPQARAHLESAWQEAKGMDEAERDVVETADALADLVYVIYGMALETGIDLPAVLSQVQASNLSKLDADGTVIKREDGKVLKGPNFFRPQVAKVLGISRD